MQRAKISGKVYRSAQSLGLALVFFWPGVYESSTGSDIKLSRSGDIFREISASIRLRLVCVCVCRGVLEEDLRNVSRRGCSRWCFDRVARSIGAWMEF